MSRNFDETLNAFEPFVEVVRNNAIHRDRDDADSTVMLRAGRRSSYGDHDGMTVLSDTTNATLSSTVVDLERDLAKTRLDETLAMPQKAAIIHRSQPPRILTEEDEDEDDVIVMPRKTATVHRRRPKHSLIEEDEDEDKECVFVPRKTATVQRSRPKRTLIEEHEDEEEEEDDFSWKVLRSCGKDFTTSDAFNTHRTKDHRTCPHCHRSYANIFCITRHIRQRHVDNGEIIKNIQKEIDVKMAQFRQEFGQEPSKELVEFLKGNAADLQKAVLPF